MRKESVKRYYANGIERKNGDPVKARTLFKDCMPHIWEDFMKGKIFIQQSPLTCEKEYENLRENPNVRIIKDEEFILYIYEEEQSYFYVGGNGESTMICKIVNFMRLINDSI